jgi:hypothetical protein
MGLFNSIYASSACPNLAKGFAASDVAHFRAPEKRNASNQDLKGHLPDWLQMDIAELRW